MSIHCYYVKENAIITVNGELPTKSLHESVKRQGDGNFFLLERLRILWSYYEDICLLKQIIYIKVLRVWEMVYAEKGPRFGCCMQQTRQLTHHLLSSIIWKNMNNCSAPSILLCGAMLVRFFDSEGIIMELIQQGTVYQDGPKRLLDQICCSL